MKKWFFIAVVAGILLGFPHYNGVNNAAGSHFSMMGDETFPD